VNAGTVMNVRVSQSLIDKITKIEERGWVDAPTAQDVIDLNNRRVIVLGPSCHPNRDLEVMTATGDKWDVLSTWLSPLADMCNIDNDVIKE